MVRAKRCVLVALGGALLVAGSWVYAQQRTAPRRVSPEDFIGIQQALWTNHHGFDFAPSDNAEMWTRSFAPEAELHNGGRVIRGENAIRQFALDYYKGNAQRRLRHWTSTFTVTPTEEGATLSAFWMITTSEDAKSAMRLGATGRYESSMVKTSDGWRIKKHVVFGEGSIVAATQ